MTDSSPNPDSGAPRWLKVFGVVFVLLAVLLVVWHLIGKGLGGLHHSAPGEHTWPGHIPPPTRADLPNSATRSESIPTDSTTTAAKPAAIAGCWELVGKAHPLRGRFSFLVDGNSLRGTVTLHGEEHQIREGTSSGHRFSFEIEVSGTKVQFEGELNQSELRGTLTRSGERLSWTAQRCPTSK